MSVELNDGTEGTEATAVASKPKRERKPRATKAPKAVKRPALVDCAGECGSCSTPSTVRMGQKVAFWMKRGDDNLRPAVAWIDGYSELTKTWRLLTLAGSIIVPQTDIPYSETPVNFCWTFEDQSPEMAVMPVAK